MAGPPPRWLDLDRRLVRHGLALLFAFAALFLRLSCIDTQPLWFDEGMTLHIVHAPDGLAYVHNTPPLYYWLLRPWTSWFGIGAAGLRSLSALAGAGFVWAAFHGARCAFGNRAALPAALLALLSPIQLYYSQEARAYALLLLLLLVALWMLWRLAERVRIGAFVLLVGASAGALYTHYLAAFLLAPAYAVCAWSPPPGARRTLVRALGAAALAVVLLLLPWLLTWSQSTEFEARDP
ncbi:MAG: hypothetical protein FJ265_17885, partial [Planctomycetes bacterium]|nr:hypothetical protein [Planctomycetota bacterium]